MNTFAKRLSKLRKCAGFKQEDFANEVGVSVDTVRRWEGEKQEPRLGELRLIAKVLGISINELAGEDTENIPTTVQEKVINSHAPRSYRKGMIVIQQGNTRLEFPATPQGYSIIRDKLKEVSINQDASFVS